MGVGPGSVIEWVEQNDEIVVRKAGRNTSVDVHRVLFPEGEAPSSDTSVKEGIRKYVRRKHARR